MTTTDNPIVTEHAILMSGGSMQVFNNDPEIEDIHLAARIRSHQRFGGKVYRRRVIVVDEWEEVARD